MCKHINEVSQETSLSHEYAQADLTRRWAHMSEGTFSDIAAQMRAISSNCATNALSISCYFNLITD